MSLRIKIIIFFATILIIAIAILVAYFVSSLIDRRDELSDTQNFNSGALAENETIEIDRSSLRFSDGKPNKLLLDLANCYYTIYSSGILKRNENFDIEKQVNEQLIKFQNIIPTQSWVEYYQQECSIIYK